MMANDNADDGIVFVYNGTHEVEASRKTIASSCAYFDRLLMGPYRESRQKRINIQMVEYSFEAFKFLIDYANTRNFDNKQKFRLYIEVIQMARVWMFDELIDQIEPLLIENISLQTITTLHTLANVDELHKLREACLAFEKILDAGGTLAKNWARCPIPGHENHHYLICDGGQAANQDEDWDREPEPPTATLSEAERNRLADNRMMINSYEFTNTKRSLLRKSYIGKLL